MPWKTPFLVLSVMVGLWSPVAGHAESVSLTVSWEAPLGNAGSGALQGYQIYRRTAAESGYPATPFRSVAATVLATQDTTVQPGIQYCYMIRVTYAGGVTPPSDEACAATLISPTDRARTVRVTFP